MKTITLKTLATGIIAMTILFTSCKKDHTCTCTNSVTSTDPSKTPQSYSDVNTMTKLSKEAAELNCQPGTLTDTQTMTADSVSHVIGVHYGQTYTFTATQTTTKTCTLK